jgi:hypothetical protein
MKRLSTAIFPASVAALTAAVLAACASEAPAPAAVPSAATASRTIEGADRVEHTNAVQVTARVLKIDHASRRVTLLLPEGREVELVVGEAAKNLAQVAVGDQVRATFYESLVFQVRKPGEATPGAGEAAGLATAEPGTPPGGLAVQMVTVTTTVKKIDPVSQTITIALADGELRTLPVRNPANLEKVKVGELLEITYSEALAIDVSKP